MMTGHEALIAMRKRGYVPRVVFIDTTPDHLSMQREWTDVNRSHACINIAESDSLAGLDLRCVVGLSVVVSGESLSRCKAVGLMSEQAGAKRIIVNVTRPLQHGAWPRTELLYCTDTAERSA